MQTAVQGLQFRKKNLVLKSSNLNKLASNECAVLLPCGKNLWGPSLIQMFKYISGVLNLWTVYLPRLFVLFSILVCKREQKRPSKLNVCWLA